MRNTMMINMLEVNETNNMIDNEKLDVRTITMGISLLDCAASTVEELNEKIYRKITSYARDLVSTGDAIGREFGVPIVNKRISLWWAAAPVKQRQILSALRRHLTRRPERWASTLSADIPRWYPRA